MTQAIGTQINSFLDGFYGIIPHELISLFDEYELVSQQFSSLYYYNVNTVQLHVYVYVYTEL